MQLHLASTAKEQRILYTHMQTFKYIDLSISLLYVIEAAFSHASRINKTTGAGRSSYSLKDWT